MFHSTYMRSFVLSFLAFSTHIGAAATTPNYTPENTVFAWDIDDVLLKKPSKFKPVMRILAKGLIRFHLLKAWYYSTDQRETGEEWAQFFEHNNSKDIADLVREISYGKTPIEGTVEILEELKACGYTHNAATNMGTKDFAFYENACPFFSHFMHKNAVNYSAGVKIKKPNPQYFTNYFDTCAPEFKKENTIFIDDRIENVKAAIAAGMIGIHFKNPAQLREELCKMGILMPVAG